MSAFAGLFRRDVALAARIGGGWALALIFFLAVVAMVPLGVGSEPGRLAALAPGMLWVAAALASLLSLDRLFQADAEDGTLDQIALSPLPLEAAAFAKCAAHWVTTGVPLTLSAPVLGLMLQLPEPGYGPLTLSLLIGTPAFSLIGAIGAALTVSVRRGGLLIALLVIPLYMPVVIFGAGAVTLAADGLPILQSLLLLGAITALALVLGPVAAAAAIRVNLT